MGSIIFFNHLNRRAAVLGDLIDVGPFQEAHADVRVAKAIGCATIAVPILFETQPGEDAVELLLVVCRKDLICWLWTVSFFQSFEGAYRPGRALAKADAALATNLDLKNCLFCGLP